MGTILVRTEIERALGNHKEMEGCRGALRDVIQQCLTGWRAFELPSSACWNPLFKHDAAS